MRPLALAALLLLAACAEPTATEYGCAPVDTIAGGDDDDVIVTVVTCVRPRAWPPK